MIISRVIQSFSSGFVDADHCLVEHTAFHLSPGRTSNRWPILVHDSPQRTVDVDREFSEESPFTSFTRGRRFLLARMPRNLRLGLSIRCHEASAQAKAQRIPMIGWATPAPRKSCCHRYRL